MDTRMADDDDVSTFVYFLWHRTSDYNEEIHF